MTDNQQSAHDAGSMQPQDLAVVTSRRGQLKQRFEQLVVEWRAQRNPYSSDPFSPANCPAYLKIIALGAEAIPLVLGELRDRPDHWFIALEALTDADPIKAEHCGDFSKMTADWLDWGARNGFLPN
jgi:hypothetical protein